MSEQNSPGVPNNDPESEGPLIDPEVKEEVSQNKPEDNFLVEYASKESGESEQIDVTKNWIGDNDGENWKPKSILSAEQIIALSQVRILPEAFEEIEGIAPLLESTVQNLEQYAVSREGIARSEHVEVLKAMHSGETDPSEEMAKGMANLFANPDENNES
jgi:hypothetical protein